MPRCIAVLRWTLRAQAALYLLAVAMAAYALWFVTPPESWADWNGLHFLTMVYHGALAGAVTVPATLVSRRPRGLLWAMTAFELMLGGERVYAAALLQSADWITASGTALAGASLLLLLRPRCRTWLRRR